MYNASVLFQCPCQLWMWERASLHNRFFSTANILAGHIRQSTCVIENVHYYWFRSDSSVGHLMALSHPWRNEFDLNFPATSQNVCARNLKLKLLEYDYNPPCFSSISVTCQICSVKKRPPVSCWVCSRKTTNWEMKIRREDSFLHRKPASVSLYGLRIQ